MLPVPAATAVLMQNGDVREALDLTEEWDNAGGDGVLTMGCVVVRTQFAKENPQAVETFLAEYEDSIRYMTPPTSPKPPFWQRSRALCPRPPWRRRPFPPPTCALSPGTI